MSQSVAQLSVAVGSVAAGVLPGVLVAAPASVPLAVAIAVAGVGVAAFLGAMLISERSDTDADLSLGFVVGPALAIGAWILHWSGAPQDPLARSLAGATIVLGPALALCLVIRFRLDPGAAAVLGTPDLVRRAVGSSRLLELAMRELPGRPDALAAIIRVFPATSGLARARAVRLAAQVKDQDRPATLALVCEALATPRGPIGDQVVGAAVDAAVRLCHPDLIAPLRALEAQGGPAFLKARAACGDLAVLADLADPRVPDTVAQETVRALGAAAVPTLAAALGKPAPDGTMVRLIELARTLGKPELFEPVAALAVVGRPAAVRAAAFKALAELDAARARPLAEGALADADEAVSFWAREVLTRKRSSTRG